MISIPSEITLESPHIEIARPKAIAIVNKAKQYNLDNDILQNMHCLEVVLSGSIEVFKAGKRQLLTPGHLTFRRKGNYQIYPSADFRSLTVFAESEFINSFLQQHVTVSIHELIRKNNDPLFSFLSSDFVTANVTEIINQISSPKSFACSITRFSIHQILLQMLSQDHSKAFLSYLHEIAGEKKIDIGYFMEENFTKRMSVKDMARSTARSVSVFKKEFVEKFNMTPMKWQINRRLEYAHFLINSSKEPVSLIAYNSGFGNLSHFSKAYKNKYGFAPSRTRQELMA